MGNESSNSNSDSNSCKSDSDSASNSGDNKNELQRMDCLIENENTIINKVWICKKSIKLTDSQVKLSAMNPFYTSKEKKEDVEIIIRLKKNIFNLKNFPNYEFKHWAVIIELSNNSYVNVQFGRNGFSLKEFNKTDIEGENLQYSILETWGEEDAPISFCFLGNANYKYEELKLYLKEIKEKEMKSFNEQNKTYYNLCFNNCQHFACDIEKRLFGKILGWHEFKFYLDEFFNNFFPNLDINKLKSKYESVLKKKNEEIILLNLKKIGYNKNEKDKSKIKAFFWKIFQKDNNTLFRYIDKLKSIIKEFPPSEKEIIKINKLYSLNFNDYLDYFK